MGAKKVKVKINGVWRQFIVDADRVLLDALRQDLHLTGAKQSCDRQGQCGACTVIVNGKAARSCLTKVVNLDGAEVITIEGLGTPENPHLIQEAFVLAGAVQCGYCTPGMIMAAKGLLDRNPNPTVQDIKEALRHNLCRCTGYNKIVEAVQLAGSFLRGEGSPDQLRTKPSSEPIGVSHLRPWSYLKACGAAEFSADIIVPGALELAVVRSPHYNALIKGIDTTIAELMPGVVGVMTAKDVKGTNSTGEMMADQPLLCDKHAAVLGAPIAVVAAETREQALAASGKVLIDYEIQPAFLNPAETVADDAPQIHDDQPNVCYTRRQVRGDAEEGLRPSAVRLDQHYFTQMVHQAAVEPEAAVAYLEGDGEEAQLIVIGRSITIHHHAEVLQQALGWDNIRYIEAFCGGQFGIKIDITSEGLAGAAALHFKRPVRYIPGLYESFLMTTKRHPFWMDLRLGADRDGKLTALAIDFIVDNGAYTSIGPVVVDRALEMLSGGYYFPSVSATSKLVYTNNAWGGAARGAGPPQVNFALESAMDELALELNMDPLEFRLLNVLKPGQPTSSGQIVEEWAYGACLERLRPIYEAARKVAAEYNGGPIRRGVGVAGASFGVGSAGDISNVAVELEDDGSLTIYASVADPGEGNDAMLTQIAAHVMGWPRDRINLVTRDTELTPNSGESAGSRQTYMSGRALVKALEDLKQAMKESGARTRADLVKAEKPARFLATNKVTLTGLDENGQGDPYDSRVHGVQLAEVEVNTETGEVRIVKMTAVVDPGVILNPLAVTGQIEGGMDMGAGWALREEYVLGQTKDWRTYKFPTMQTSFDMETILLESPRKNGPLGATGVGEFTLMPTAPAVNNAIFNAVGVRIRELPATPDKIRSSLAGLQRA